MSINVTRWRIGSAPAGSQAAWCAFTDSGHARVTEVAMSIAAVRDEANRDKRYAERRRRI